MSNPSNGIHRSAADGYVVAADEYVRGRPDYPPQMAQWLLRSLHLGPGTSVVDLGAGTGKFTPHLLQTGAKVIAVEPVGPMRAKLSAAFPQVETLAGFADKIPLGNCSVNAVICAQAFHWFATHQALAEIRRVLKPGGKLGLVWNVRDNRVAWMSKLDEIFRQLEGDTPRYYTGAWRHVFPSPGFGPMDEQQYPHSQVGNPEDVVVSRVRSVSFIAALPDPQRREIDRRIRALVEDEPLLAGKAVVTMPYMTHAYCCTKL